MADSLTIKELPNSEKPYEKCLAHGAASLSDAELLAVIIRTGSCGEPSIELARRILAMGPDGILNLHTMSIGELTALKGIGPVKAVQLKCAAEISVRMAGALRADRIEMNNPETIASYYMERMRHLDRETVLLSMYNVRCRLIGDEVMTIGTSTSSLISPGGIFRCALKHDAEYIVLLHNHPSGDPSPSEDDMLSTDRIASCGRLMGIPLMDHIIIGDNRYYSFRENHLITD